MPGQELIGREELASIQELFEKSGGVLFAHGYDAKRKGIYRVRDFEKAAAAKVGAKYCQAVSSGTAAGHVALAALGVGPGDEVIVPSFTFVATIEAVLATGATPVVVDVDETLNMCPVATAHAITPRTKCLMPVHMMGSAARIEDFLQLGKTHGIPVVEDACQAFGGTYRGKALGTIGRLGFVSLDFNKTITTGEGGLIFTDDEVLARHMSAFHDHGHENAPGLPRGCDTASFAGFNYRLTEVQAAIGIAQLKKLEDILRAHRRNKMLLKEGLSTLGSKIQFREILDPSGEVADAVIFYLPTAHAAAAAAKHLAERGVGTKNLPDATRWHFAGHWDHIWSKSERYRDNFKTVWKKSADLLDRSVSLPVNVLTPEAEIRRIVDATIESVRKGLS